MIVIDAESLINDSKYKNPSQDHTAPTAVTNSGSYIFMVAPTESAVSSEATSAKGHAAKNVGSVEDCSG